MKALFSLAAALFLLLPLNINASELKLGEPLTLETVTPVSEINKHPEKYLDKRVLIEGLVINVCAKRGCWVDIASDLPFEKIQVKVVDGEIVFPMEAKGRMARVEGVPEEMNLTKEQAIRMGKHRAEEQGTSLTRHLSRDQSSFIVLKGLGRSSSK